MPRPALATLAAAAILLAAAAAGAEEEPADPKPVDWKFLKPGVTTLAETLEKAGPADLTLQRVLRKGLLDLDPRDDHSGAFGQAPRIKPEDQVPVTVLEYSARKDEVHDNLLVFHKDRLLYAVFRPPDDETGLSDIEERYGDNHRQIKTELLLGCETTVYVAILFDAYRMAFVTEEKDVGCFECKSKLMWADPKRLDPTLAEVEWKLPEVKGSGEKK